MSTAAAVKRTAEQVLGKDKIISSDSHIMEPPDLWEANLTPSLKTKFPKFPPRNTAGFTVTDSRPLSGRFAEGVFSRASRTRTTQGGKGDRPRSRRSARPLGPGSHVAGPSRDQARVASIRSQEFAA